MSDLEKFRVSVTVFAEVEAVDIVDAGHIVSHAVWSAFGNATRSKKDVVISAAFSSGVRDVRVAQIMETGMAAGNGYLWTQPTNKAFRERWSE